MKFITRCICCGDQNQFDHIGYDEIASIQIYFHCGTPNTKDRVVIYCENCGNKQEIAADHTTS